MNRLAVAVVAGAVLTACGVAGDSELQRIDSADLAGLDVTTTSSSSTTTTIVVPDTSVTTNALTSTTIATEQVSLYYVDGSQLVPVSRDLARSPAGVVSPQRVLAALVAGPPAGNVGIGLRSVLPPSLVNSVVDSGEGYVTVDLAADAFAEIDPADQRTAIAQIVLTLVGRPGIGQVGFTLDGEPLRVPRRNNLQSGPGELVSRQDYESLLQEIEPETTTTEPPVEPTVPPVNTAPL